MYTDWTNAEIAQVFEEISEMLEVAGESPFRVAAYQKAANAIRSQPERIVDLFFQGKLREIRGIGESIAQKIGELIESGGLRYYDELKEKIPFSVLKLMQVPGVGPKKARVLYEELNIQTIDDLEKAVKEQKIRYLKGFGAKTEENIVRGVAIYRQGQERLLLSDALPLAEEIVSQLSEAEGVEQTSTAGSLRRLKETIGDIDILVATLDSGKVSEKIMRLPQVKEVLAAGETKISVRVQSDLQVDFRLVKPENYGAALQYFTGSKEHNIKLREIAKKRGWKINEYGLFEIASDRKLAGQIEEEIYQMFGLPLIPPPLREDRGEIEAAFEGKLPAIIELSDIKGDLHVHSIYSDGTARLEELAVEGIKLGYSYLAVCDHAQRLRVARGMTPQEVEKRLKEIEKVNQRYPEIKLLNGVELNIENDGTVDYPLELLATFDLVSASVHWGFGQTREEITYRTLKAIENPYINIVCHPTGRIINKRPAFEIDLPRVFKLAAETGTFLELNSYPDRLDLKDEHLLVAMRDYGCKFAIGTDAHGLAHLGNIRYGVATAQRGWLEKKDVLNCYSLTEVLTQIREKRKKLGVS